MKRKTDNVITSVGMATAIGASMCCIGPVLAFFAGASGMVAAFSWFEPMRPILIALTAILLTFAWYQKLKPGISCDCDAEKTAFVRSKLFLAIVTMFATAILSFPYYAGVFYPNSNPPSRTASESQTLRSGKFFITGMTCEGCSKHVQFEGAKVDGVIGIDVSYEKGTAVVDFDASTVSVDAISEAINSTGYHVTNYETTEP